LGIGDWAQSPIPNPQSPIPNPQSPILILQNLKHLITFSILLDYYFLIYISYNIKNYSLVIF